MQNVIVIPIMTIICLGSWRKPRLSLASAKFPRSVDDEAMMSLLPSSVMGLLFPPFSKGKAHAFWGYSIKEGKPQNFLGCIPLEVPPGKDKP